MKERTIVVILVLWLSLVAAGKGMVYYRAYNRNPESILVPDSDGYIQSALALLQTGRFAINPESPQIPQVVRTPGYSVFLAAIWVISGKNFEVLILAQIIVSLGTLVAIYGLGRLLWNAQIGLLAVVLLTCDVPSFVTTPLVLTETLFTCVITLAAVAGVAALRGRRGMIRLMMCHACLLAGATFIRPIAYYTIGVSAIVILLAGKWLASWSWKRIVGLLLAAFIPWSILIGGWHVRNYVKVGVPRFSFISGATLFFCRVPAMMSLQEGISYEEARRRMGSRLDDGWHPEQDTFTMVTADRQWQQDGFRFIVNHPGLFLQTQVRSFLKMMLGTGWRELSTLLVGEGWDTGLTGGPAGDIFTLDFLEYRQKWLIQRPGLWILYGGLECLLGVLYLTGIFGAWRTFRKIRQEPSSGGGHVLVWFILLNVLVFSISFGPEGTMRFRIPLMPLLAGYSAYGIVEAVRMGRAYIVKRRHIIGQNHYYPEGA